MLNVGDCVEFHLVMRELVQNEKVNVKAIITRINELGCFVRITSLEPEQNLVLGGRVYGLGDEVYMLNSTLKPCLENQIDSPHPIKNNLIWGWGILVMMLIMLWLFAM
jgi:hypothetical protein